VTVVDQDMYGGVSSLKETGPFDLVFFDQEMDEYLPDLLFLEKNNIVRKGGVVVADNILYPGAPYYLAHMQEAARQKHYRSVLYHTYKEYTDIPDTVIVS
jgi:catechol O-methyltransferase